MAIRPVADRFWEKVRKSDNGCWEWTGALFKSGYGAFGVDGKTVRAHRHAWMVANCEMIGPDNVVMHSCDNPRCVNPDHLSVADHAENIRDRDRKGRLGIGPGHGQAKLNEQKVREIRRRSKEGVSASSLGREFGVCAATIIDARDGKNWKHVT